jgi:hypothetical protein
VVYFSCISATKLSIRVLKKPDELLMLMMRKDLGIGASLKIFVKFLRDI